MQHKIAQIKVSYKLKNMLFTLETKKGVPLYSNLINLKSNTMKNTLQMYTLINMLSKFSSLVTCRYIII